MSTANLPRVNLGQWPTPLHELPRLSAALGGPRIFIKRDDLSGLALGGNKCRKLEYILAQAQQEGVDSIITTGGSQSNFALQTAAAARQLGMEPYLVLLKGIHPEMQGNLLLHSILKASVNIIDIAGPNAMFTIMPQTMEELANDLRAKGHTPMVIPVGGSIPIGTVGWVNAATEIADQMKGQHIDVQYVILANGSGGTYAGLVLGFKHLGLALTTIGISISHPRADVITRDAAHIRDTAELMGLGTAVAPTELSVYDDYIGQGYGIATRECLEAIRLVAQTEAIFFDPVYTGKAMAGLISLINKGDITKNDTVLFIHTGGVAADFAYHRELATEPANEWA
ncbi:MAG: D-cysteine desulfhydrase family protein [Dehalococcoidia bacterium]|nr:D-cysteine desulfhydrase family protein [Dehalococcoidia bacterium]